MLPRMFAKKRSLSATNCKKRRCTIILPVHNPPGFAIYLSKQWHRSDAGMVAHLRNLSTFASEMNNANFIPSHLLSWQRPVGRYGFVRARKTFPFPFSKYFLASIAYGCLYRTCTHTKKRIILKHIGIICLFPIYIHHQFDQLL